LETKVPFYTVINILLPGLVFIGVNVFLFFDIVSGWIATISGVESFGFEFLLTLAALAVAYEVGYIIFRIGAIIVEPILKKLFGWEPYEKFVEAKKAGAKSLDMLSQEYGYARTHISLFFLLLILVGIQKHWILLCICVMCFVIFTLAARSFIKKIIKTINVYLSQNEGEV